ncbi:zinc finger protein 271-like, partial [Contarinia nasturtii]|uniref:zinc finger protein 271-like n=1 Tax=Contarinia nasturtii TaxID=265458 RepID=UPI0012D47884
EGEIVEWDDVKNIDPNVIYAKHRFQCRLCKTLETNVILHYKKVHAEFELLISRPSPTMAEKIRRRTENFIYTPHFDQISGICFFCELPRSLSLTEWKKHILYHTGEMEPNTSFDVFSGAQLTAFMCKLCNYIQTDQNRLTKHLRKEHKKCGGEIAIGFEQIILIPDLTPLTPIQVVNKYVFIEEAKRFKCGIGWCDTQLNGFANFKAHLRQKHRNTDENFGCLHCSELINATGKSFLHDVSEHMELHGKFIYSCLFCERVFSERNHVILHIIREHPEKQMKFNYCKREKSNMPEITEQLQIMLKCNLCTEFSYTMEHASAHFKIHHKSLDIDFTTNTLRKFTVPDSTTTLTFTKNTLQTLRRFFECSQCEETRFNEVSLIKHFTKSHQTHSLVLKPGDFFIKAIDPTETSTQLNRIQTVFYCYHCYEGNEKRKFIGFGNCQEVLTHWLATHKEPFRFFIAEMAKCFYCDLMGTYQGLKLHHGDVHSNKKFAIVDVLDPKKCSLCQYIGDRVEEHFQNEHSSISITNLFCPIPLSDKSLKKLIEMKGHKNRLCGLCHQTFETKIDYKVHHGNKHILFKENVEKFYNNESVHLITGCCQAIVDHKKLFNHLKVHPISSQCPNCTFKALDLYEFTAHQLNVHHPGNDVRVVYREAMQKIYWKTKVVFGNGLVLSKHNLLGTKYDDSELFGVFVENIIKNNEEIL